MLELAAKERGPGRILERQGRQRVEHGIATLVLPVIGLYTENGGDDLRWHAVTLLCLLQQLAMRAQELGAVDGTRLGDEDGPVAMPWQGLGRTCDGLER